MAYRGPDGEYVKDADTAIAAWQSLAERVLAFFPGYILHSFDPFICIKRYERSTNGRSRVVDRIELSVMAATCLVTKMEPPRVLRDDF